MPESLPLPGACDALNKGARNDPACRDDGRREITQYFNAGVPQDAEAAAAGTLTSCFTHPRGPGSLRGLGLSHAEVDDLTDFLENALYDAAFVPYDCDSPTKMFELDPRNVLNRIYRPDLAALGAVDGRPGSGRPQNNDDPLRCASKGMGSHRR